MTLMPTDGERTMRFLVMSGSLRTGSLNTALTDVARRAIEENGGEVDQSTLREFDSPSYNVDEHQRHGLAAGAQAFKDRLESCDAFVIASPEFNASVPGSVKNLIDWVSRSAPQPFNERHCLLMSASPSMVGGNRGLWALRVPLEHLGARVYPDMFSLAQAHQAFDEDGGIKDEALRDRFDNTVMKFMELAEASKHYPCAKRAWVEYLGEQVNAETARAEV